MDTIERVAGVMQTVLDTAAREAARRSGFVKRRSKMTGEAFLQTLVFGWLSNPEATLEELAQTAAVRGVRISPQGLDQRFSEAAAEMLRMVLEAAASMLVSGEAADVPLLNRFEGVYLLDSSTLSLPQELKGLWPGCGGSTPSSGAAALKLQVMLDLKAGAMHGPELAAGRAHDRSSGLQHEPLPEGSLRITDLGYFSLGRLEEMDRAGVYWLLKPSVQTVLFGPGGRRMSLPELLAEQDGDEMEVQVLVGAEKRLGCRLVGVLAPQEVAAGRRRKMRAQARREGRTVSAGRLAVADWTLALTNAPPRLLSLREALVLYRARWQIETLFKLWKSCGGLARSRSARPVRVLCETYAKLLVMLVQHWVLITSCWVYPDRSLAKASATIRRSAMALAWSFSQTRRLRSALRAIRDCLASGCRTNRRRGSPATHQLLQASPPPPQPLTVQP